METDDGKKRKRVFFIDPMSMGNPARYDYWLLSAIANYDITYFCSKFIDISAHQHLTYRHVFRYNNLSNATLKTLSYICSYACILVYILVKRPDIIHVQWFKIPISDLVFYKVVKMLTHAKLIFTAHNVLPHNSGKRYAASFKKIYHLFDRIIVHSKRTRHEMLGKFRLPSDHVVVIVHGIHPMHCDKCLYAQQEEELDKKYGLSGKFVFSSLGEQSPYKGIDMLARVWAETEALRSDDNLRLIIAGKVKGLDLSMLEGINNVTVVDKRISDEEYFYLLIHSDVQLFPYRQISQSGALMIALAHHIPVLVTDEGALTDALNVANVGWKIGSCTFQRLRDALIAIAGDKQTAARIKEDQQEWQKVEQAFDWHKISLETQALYDSLC